MNVSYSHESIRLNGRWDKSSTQAAVTTAPGSYIEFAFYGEMALALFDVENNFKPFLRLWIQIDGGDMVETVIDSYIRIKTVHTGKHICKIIYKGGTEASHRWNSPLRGKVSFIGIQTQSPIPLGEDTRKSIEFIGDSITEGVLIDVDFYRGGNVRFDIDQLNRPWQDDVCATYAYLTAEALNLRPIFMGYGGVGVTRAGVSGVPAATESYLYNFDGSPITHNSADYILINHGANDRNAGVENYLDKYRELLDVVREHNKNSVVIALSAFVGVYHEELGQMIEEYNAEHRCNVYYIDSFGWIPTSPLHPLRDGHKTVSEHLVPILKNIIDNS